MSIFDLSRAHIAVVDDQEINVKLLERTLHHGGYRNVHTYTDPRQFLIATASVEPDLVLLDLRMPFLDGFAVLQRLHAMLPDAAYLPIIVLTADVTPDAKRQALEQGARDFLTKPFDAIEVLLRIKNLLDLRMLYRQLRDQNRNLEEKVRERTQALEDAQIEILERLARAAEYRDDDTGQHTGRVGYWAAAIADELGLPTAEVELIRRVAPLHDVGKIGVPDGILLKPGKLSPDEFEIIKMHTEIGAGILNGSSFPLLQVAARIALTHHERWDGSGYPRGLAGEEIPLVGRIVAVADVFDALTHARPYKAAWSTEEALAEIERQSGRQFDPAVVAAFRDLVTTAELEELPELVA